MEHILLCKDGKPLIRFRSKLSDMTISSRKIIAPKNCNQTDYLSLPVVIPTRVDQSQQGIQELARQGHNIAGSEVF